MTSEFHQPIAFFCRAKPKGVDALSIFREAGRVFIGYPLDRSGVEYDPRNLCTCLVNPKECDDREWERQLKSSRRKTSPLNQNRNFIRRVGVGSIVVVPRPEQGAAYIARVTGRFEIVNRPPWAERYLELRRKQGEQGVYLDDDRNHHVADVAQGWPVDEYRRVELSRLAGWLRHSMYGRSTYGIFKNHPMDEGPTAYSALSALLEDRFARLTWTMDLCEIKKRLVDTMTASSFEHLIVSLLQLENPDEVWRHTGGPGDGGIDGLGSDDQGNIVGLMQAKLHTDSVPSIPELHRRSDVRRYAAVLVLQCNPPELDGIELLGLDWIAKRVHRHWKYLPQARAMRVGRPNSRRSD